MKMYQRAFFFFFFNLEEVDCFPGGHRINTSHLVQPAAERQALALALLTPLLSLVSWWAEAAGQLSPSPALAPPQSRLSPLLSADGPLALRPRSLNKEPGMLLGRLGGCAASCPGREGTPAGVRDLAVTCDFMTFPL